jgi:hypothetical protein
MIPPDMAEVPPPMAADSRAITWAPASAASIVAAAPEAPRPTTTTSASMSQPGTSPACSGSIGAASVGRPPVGASVFAIRAA